MAISIFHAKRERSNFEGATYHIITRCNNRQNLISNDIDFMKYKHFLRKYKKQYGFLLYDYAIVNSHPHLAIQLGTKPNISKIMHSINRCYASWYNKHYGRKGHFWENRFFGEPIKDDRQLLAVMRYIELNPVRAGLCKNPADWKYSGAQVYLKGKKDTLIDIPEVYIELGRTDKERQQNYSNIFPI